MNVQKLSERAQLLQTELQRAKLSVVTVTEQLEQAKAHLSQVTGHLNETNYLLNEARQEEHLRATAISQENLGGQENGEAIKQEQE